MPKLTHASILKELRKLLPTLPDATEGTHFDSIAFKARGKLFATLRDADGEGVLAVQLEPAHAEHWLDRDPRITRYPRAPEALLIPGSGIPSAKLLRALFTESYALGTAKKKPAARRKKR
ncbi:MAG: MmcQ/YjbR family DNA-binding protein [Deltaproteobacteria bacterium]|nr:MmcQ/YjbR family DNA-binding protein [Deltaproteobacteria bacterium]